MWTASALSGFLLVTATACATGYAGSTNNTADFADAQPAACDVQHAADDTSRVFTEREVQTHAQPVPGTKPARPFAQLPPGQRYRVTLQLLVDTLGRVDPCRSRVSAESESGLGAPLLEDVLGWHWTPATNGGRKVREVLHMTMRRG